MNLYVLLTATMDCPSGRCNFLLNVIIRSVEGLNGILNMFCSGLGFRVPTRIQQQCIPVLLVSWGALHHTFVPRNAAWPDICIIACIQLRSNLDTLSNVWQGYTFMAIAFPRRLLTWNVQIYGRASTFATMHLYLLPPTYQKSSCRLEKIPLSMLRQALGKL